MRVCSGSNCLISVGGVGLRVFKIMGGSRMVKIGFFRGPGIPRRVHSHIQGRSLISFHLGCSFQHTRKCCLAGHSSVVRLCAGIAGLCSGRKGFDKCVLVGVSGARHVSTVGHVHSFRGFFLLVSSCTGIECTGLGLVDQGKCTVGR